MSTSKRKHDDRVSVRGNCEHICSHVQPCAFSLKRGKKYRVATEDVRVKDVNPTKDVSYMWPSDGRFRVFDEAMHIDPELFILPRLEKNDIVNNLSEVVITVGMMDCVLKKKITDSVEPSGFFCPLWSSIDVTGKNNLLVYCSLMCAITRWMECLYARNCHTCYASMTVDEITENIFERMWIVGGVSANTYKKNSYPTVRMAPFYLTKKSAVQKADRVAPWEVVKRLSLKVFGLADQVRSLDTLNHAKRACGPFEHVDRVMKFVSGTNEITDMNEIYDTFNMLRLAILNGINWPEVTFCKKNTMQQFIRARCVTVDCYDEQVVKKLMNTLDITGACGYHIYNKIKCSEWHDREEVYGPLPVLLVLSFDRKLKCDIVFSGSILHNKLYEAYSTCNLKYPEGNIAPNELTSFIPAAFHAFCSCLNTVKKKGHDITHAMNADTIVYVSDDTAGIKLHSFHYEFGENSVGALTLFPSNSPKNDYSDSLRKAVFKAFEVHGDCDALLLGVLLIELTQHQFREEFREFDSETVEDVLQDVVAGASKRLWMFAACRSESLCLLVAYIMNTSIAQRPSISEICASRHMARWVASGDMEAVSDMMQEEDAYQVGHNVHFELTERIINAVVGNIPGQNRPKLLLDGGWRQGSAVPGWKRKLLDAFSDLHSSPVARNRSSPFFLRNNREVHIQFYNMLDGVKIPENGSGTGVVQEAITMYCMAVNSLGLFSKTGSATENDWYTLGSVVANSWMRNHEMVLEIPMHLMKWMVDGENAKFGLTDMYFLDKKRALLFADLLLSDDDKVFENLMLDLSDPRWPLSCCGPVNTGNVEMYVDMQIKSSLLDGYSRKNIRAMHKGYSATTLDIRPPNGEVLYDMFGPWDLAPTYEDVVCRILIADVLASDAETEVVLQHGDCLTAPSFHECTAHYQESDVTVYCVASLLKEYLRMCAPEKLIKFLMFVTSRPHLPRDPEKYIKIVIKETFKNGMLPTSATCVLQLTLYQEMLVCYKNREHAQYWFNSRMDYATGSSSAFGLV